MNIEMIKELKTTKQQLKELQDRCNKLYKSNEEKKFDNQMLRKENNSLKKKNIELSILLDTFLKLKKEKK